MKKNLRKSFYAPMLPFFFLTALNVAVSGELNPVTTGYYYYLCPPGEEGRGSDGKSVPVSFEQGLLVDETRSKAPGRARWFGHADAPICREVVMDLGEDRQVEKIVLVSRPENSFWGANLVNGFVRSDSESYYRILGERTYQSPEMAFEVGGKVRFIKFKIVRYNPYSIVPLNEIRILASDQGRLEQKVISVPTAAMFEKEAKTDPLMIDRYGQYLYEEWPGKVKSDKDLVADAEAEGKKLVHSRLDTDRFDQYGGIKDGKTYEATGFFQLKEIDGRWWFLTPEGHRYFLIGVDCTFHNEWGYQTPLKHADNTPRGVFQELPVRKQFHEAYENPYADERVSFITANLKRKYGKDFETIWADRMMKRYRDWGFNGNGKWTKHWGITLPYITVMMPFMPKKVYGTVDPFDPEYESNLDREFKTFLIESKNNPWIIGHTFDNENGWNKVTVKVAGQNVEPVAAKVALVDFLARRYKNDVAALNKLFGTKVETIKALEKTPIDTDRLPEKDVNDFITMASRKYYAAVSKLIKRYDPNHLFLGFSGCIEYRNCPAWELGSLDYVDALSVDIYGIDLSWTKQYATYKKPLLLLEFSFFTIGRGLSGFIGTVPTQVDRGRAYRYYVENLAALPYMVGFGWFTCYDSSVTKRTIPDGEGFNQGLLNVCDQPYDEMIVEMKKTNRRIYDIHAGKLQPVNQQEAGGK